MFERVRTPSTISRERTCGPNTCSEAHTDGSHCRREPPLVGDAKVGDKTAKNAAWAYGEQREQKADSKDYVSFVGDAMDAWIKEEQEISGHPRDPYKRVDAIQSTCHVKVVVGDETVAETNQAGLAVRDGSTNQVLYPQDPGSHGIARRQRYGHVVSVQERGPLLLERDQC